MASFWTEWLTKHIEMWGFNFSRLPSDSIRGGLKWRFLSVTVPAQPRGNPCPSALLQLPTSKRPLFGRVSGLVKLEGKANLTYGLDNLWISPFAMRSSMRSVSNCPIRVFLDASSHLYSMFQLVWNIKWRHNSRSNTDIQILKKTFHRWQFGILWWLIPVIF